MDEPGAHEDPGEEAAEQDGNEAAEDQHGLLHGRRAAETETGNGTAKRQREEEGKPERKAGKESRKRKSPENGSSKEGLKAGAGERTSETAGTGVHFW